MTAIVNLVSGLAWPFVVALGVWYFRDELKNALKRITGIGFNELKFGAPPEQQIPSSPSTVAAQELPSPSSKPDVLAPKPNLDAFIERIRSFISADQLDPVLQRLRADLVPTAGPDTSDQIEILMYLVASLSLCRYRMKEITPLFLEAS